MVLLILPGFLGGGGGGRGASEFALLLELARRCCNWRAVTGRILLESVCLEAAEVRDLVEELRTRDATADDARRDGRVASLLIARARDVEAIDSFREGRR